jgi:hypothetical protein
MFLYKDANVHDELTMHCTSLETTKIQFSAPVYYHGRWSCYFWDFQKKRVIVLDPTRMGLNAANVEMQHGHLVDKLTKALFACIRRFFSRWDFDETKWSELYPTNHGPRSKMYDVVLIDFISTRITWYLVFSSESKF